MYMIESFLEGERIGLTDTMAHWANTGSSKAQHSEQLVNRF